MRRSLRSRIPRLALAVIAGLFLAGCTALIGAANSAPGPEILPSPSPAEPATPVRVPTDDIHADARPPEGWTEHKEGREGFAVALPASWQKVDADSEMLAGALEALRRQSPELASLLANAGGSLASSELRFLAFDLGAESLADGFPANLSVLRRPVGAHMSLEEFGTSNVRELGRVAQVCGPVQRETVRLPAGEALRLRYQLSVDSREGSRFDRCLTQFLLVRGRQGYILTFSTVPAGQEKYEPIFEQIGRSFRWL